MARAHSGWAEFATLLDSCSQPSAEFVVQFLEPVRSFHSAFFSIPLQHGAPNRMRCDAVARSFESPAPCNNRL
jgi:hypothetical protein